MLEVKVLSYTPNAEVLCALAMRSTKTLQAAHNLVYPSMPRCRPDDLREYEACRAKALEKKLDWHSGWAKCRYDKQCAERMLIEAKNQKHWGVFEHAVLTVSVEGVSRACTHQLVRHRQDSFLQQSQRAVKINTGEDWYVVPESVKKSTVTLEWFKKCMGECSGVYGSLLSQGIEEEDARFVLPNACKTNIVITANARQWLHIFKLRLASTAQWEIREMCQKILKEFMKISPVIFEGAGQLEV